MKIDKKLPFSHCIRKIFFLFFNWIPLMVYWIIKSYVLNSFFFSLSNRFSSRRNSMLHNIINLLHENYTLGYILSTLASLSEMIYFLQYTKNNNSVFSIFSLQTQKIFQIVFYNVIIIISSLENVLCEHSFLSF